MTVILELIYSPRKVATEAVKVAYLLENKDEYKEKIQEVVENHSYYPHRSGEAGGRYIINQLEKRQ